MKTIILFTLCAVGLTVCAPLRAADPPAEAQTGKVLVLFNERTIQGDVEKAGESYRVRRQTGEVLVRAADVLKLCADMEEAFRFVRSRANLRDPDERLRLADWCNVRGLRTQAVAEVAAAAELRPDHAPTQRLLAHLRDMPPPRDQAPAPEAEPDAAPPSVDLTTESLCAFSTRVQPVLMNACANCHAGGKGGAFKLTRTSPDAMPGSRAVQQNLTAVLAQLNLQQPEGSKLLTKAVSAHGAVSQAPLKGRQAQAYRLLEDWVKHTVETNPQLRAQAGLPPTPPPAAEEKPAAEPQPAKDPKEEKAAPPSSFGETQQPEPAGPVDPFDPIIFNRQMHPPR